MLDEKIKLVNFEFMRLKRDTMTAYILFVFFWFAGVHKFYLRRTPEGIMYVVLVLSGAASFFSGLFLFEFVNVNLLKVGLVISLLILVFLVYDLLTLWRQVEKANEKIYVEIYEKITGVPYYEASHH